VVAGFWHGLGVVVGIGGPEAGNVPTIYRLHQNLPNPLTTSTVVRFDVPEDGARIALRIYDLRGALVAVLARGPKSAGEKSVVWDGRDARGGRSAAGVYLCVLDTPKQRLVRKLTVLR
jgi:flagellar hook assembly protein FlgD